MNVQSLFKTFFNARCLNHGVYQPGKPGNLREFFQPGILREISGNFNNSLEK